MRENHPDFTYRNLLKEKRKENTPYIIHIIFNESITKYKKV